MKKSPVIVVIASLGLAMLSVIVAHTDEQHPTQIRFENIQEAHHVPRTIQYIFSLRDQDGHAVLFDPSSLNFMEDIRIWENDDEIDTTESHPYIYSQKKFGLQVMVVLDFTESMHSHENGIQLMKMGAKALIDTLRETHQVAVVEYHDDQYDFPPYTFPTVLQPFTTDHEAAKAAIDSFHTDAPGFSVCWDAVDTALAQFPIEPDLKSVRVVVFLSDGFDNSSNTTPADLISRAQARNVHIYNIGVGSIATQHENTLKNISSSTGGIYEHAENIDDLIPKFEQIIRDLGGQYKIKYVTPKQPEDGIFTVESTITYLGVTTDPPLQRQVDPSQIHGDDRRGIIAFQSPAYVENNKADIFVLAQHVPRHIREFRFWLDPSLPCHVDVELTDEAEGGLCSNWTLTEQTGGWYRLVSPGLHDFLGFGNYGTICKIGLTNLTASGLAIPFQLDNSIYTEGRLFFGGDESELGPNLWTTEILLGFPFGNPMPSNNEQEVSIFTSLSWTVGSYQSAESVTYDLYLDPYISPPTTRVAPGLTMTAFTPEDPLEGATKYYWKVVANTDRGTFSSSIWEFETLTWEIPSEGLFAYYPFSGNSDDVGMNNNHATLYGPSWSTDRFEQPDRACQFDGIDDYIVFPRFVYTSGHSLSACIHCTSYDAQSEGPWNPALTVIGDASPKVYGAFGVHNGRARYTYYISEKKGWNYFDSDVIVSDGTWHIITATHDSNGTIKLYVDGNLEKEGVATYNSDGRGYNRIGCGYGSAQAKDYFHGLIDEIIIYDRPLTAEEIDQLCELMTGVDDNHLSNNNYGELPHHFALHQNYPNPFNPTTTIQYDLPDPAHVKIKIFNVMGQLVEILVDGALPAGYHSIVWDGGDVSSGIYFYQITAGEHREVKKCVLLR
jgi:hypothetical protein